MAMTPEGKVKAAIIKLLKAEPRCWYFMPVSNGMGTTGIPDIIACVDGRFLAIEVKAPGKLRNTTPLQRMQLDRIALSMGIAMVADNAADVADMLEDIRTC